MIQRFFRTFRHRPLVTSLQVGGLAIGLATSYLVHLYVAYERSYDGYHLQADHIYRLDVGGDQAPAPMGPTLLKEYPEVRNMVQWLDSHTYMVFQGSRPFGQDGVVVADSSLFSIFTFPLLEGNPHQALVKPFSAVLSRTAAHKYFGTEDPLGKTLKLDGYKWGRGAFLVTVTGVMEDIPANSSFRSDLILSRSTQQDPDTSREAWTRPATTFLLLPGGPERLLAALHSFMAVHGIGPQPVVLEPLKSIHPQSSVPIFSTIGFLVLLLACFNFINLSTAQAFAAAREVSVRKIIGASRLRLVGQFLGDALGLSLAAFVLAGVLTILFLPALNQLSGKVVCTSALGCLWPLLLLALSAGFAAGLYPALLLSSIPLSMVVPKGTVLRKVLVVVQFTVSIVLLMGTAVVYRQMAFIRNYDLGFKKNQMLVLDVQRDSVVNNHVEYVKAELLRLPHVHAVSASSGTPVSSGFEPVNYDLQNANGAMQPLTLPMYMVDKDFFRTYQVKVLAGRTFSGDRTDSGLVVNEAVLRQLGYRSPQDILGKRFSGEGHPGPVVGVVSDFHFMSLRESIGPLLFRDFFVTNRYITLDMDVSSSTLQALETRWNELEPQCPFHYFFLDEAIGRQYQSDANLGKLILYFGSAALVICCLGLFGLALFSTYRRTREIGIRKVLGASVAHLVRLLSQDFLGLVLLAALIASPIGWWAGQAWLDGFAYRTTMAWWIFPAAGFLASLVAMATVSLRTVKAARANPVDSLRTE